MFTLITVLVIIICFLLLLIVLIQNPKGGLDSAFSANNQIMGVRKTTNFLEKATWTLGIALVVLSIASSAVNPTKTAGVDETNDSKIKELIDEKAAPTLPNMNNAPVPAQENQEGQ
ncbi:MAG TPA: preprotein translocase subunit SecG [Vicingaceae bacterium]|jgi:preprotein translocase subunit SecG|nr:preprotein translocase subunit SecG [Vicingaceae bacterium]